MKRDLVLWKGDMAKIQPGVLPSVQDCIDNNDMYGLGNNKRTQ